MPPPVFPETVLSVRVMPLPLIPLPVFPVTELSVMASVPLAVVMPPPKPNVSVFPEIVLSVTVTAAEIAEDAAGSRRCPCSVFPETVLSVSVRLPPSFWMPLFGSVLDAQVGQGHGGPRVDGDHGPIGRPVEDRRGPCRCVGPGDGDGRDRRGDGHVVVHGARDLDGGATGSQLGEGVADGCTRTGRRRARPGVSASLGHVQDDRGARRGGEGDSECPERPGDGNQKRQQTPQVNARQPAGVDAAYPEPN